MHLLDLNVLIARADSAHPHHRIAVEWMATNASAGWATCPLTENGFLRILGQPTYQGGPGSPAGALVSFRQILALPGHKFLPDDFSLTSGVPTLNGVTSGQLTDIYLLALAVRHRARFLSLDRRIDPSLVPGGSSSYVQLSP
ncbi:TA system VapC family ribonuclease toxin [Luteolibacter sp. Populi]|uniref:TA system VapC family ribonuclease toxin n=1 Tax=Luteolibacter sp. Populi TaxID=3230487 RepID=UPI003467CBD5